MNSDRASVMQHRSHQRTLIALLRDAVEDWRKGNAWSRESAAQMIVEAHERIGGPASSGIVFDPPSRDAFERAKANADRIFRWLDDSTKDKNLLPANFIMSILAALPAERRLCLADELLTPVGLGARYSDDETDDATEAQCVVTHFKAVVECSAEANIAMSQMLSGIRPGEPERAKTKLARAAATMQRALGMVNRLIRRKGKGKKP